MAFTPSTDTKLLLAKLKATFPDFEYKDCKHLKHGFDHDVLIIDKYVYRFPKTKYYVKQLASEANLTAYLFRKVDLRFPVYDYIADDFSFARHPLIKGVEVTENTFRLLSSHKIKMLTTNIASFLTTLHTIPSSKNDYFGFVENRYNTTLGKVPNYVPTHSDLDINNLLWDKEEGLGIIDFGDRCLFDPAYDFTIFNLFGETFIYQIYEEYQGPKDPSFLNRAAQYYQQYLSSKKT